MIYLDGERLQETVPAHLYLKEILHFPEYYGMNLDSLYDCLTDFKDLTIVLTEPAVPSDTYGAFLRVLQAAAQEGGFLLEIRKKQLGV